MARGEPDHARRGGKLLRDLDMPLMAEIVETHMDMAVGEGRPIGEAEVVFLADKLVQEDRFVGLADRFRLRLDDSLAEFTGSRLRPLQARRRPKNSRTDRSRHRPVAGASEGGAMTMDSRDRPVVRCIYGWKHRGAFSSVWAG